MLRDVLEFLACPHCGAGLDLDGHAVFCPNGHSYDVARHGYVNLLGGDASTATADTAAMVAAREAFFGVEHFAPLVRAVADEAQRVAPGEASGCVIDLGAGPGRYLSAVLERLPGSVGLALDLSKYALRRAARRHPRIGAAVCDVWRPLPVRTDVAALVLDVFAPRNGAEIRRVLRRDGALLAVTPTTDHLRELVSALGLLTVGEDKPDRVRRQLAPHLTLVRETPVTFTMTLTAADVHALVAMGPSAWHVDRDHIDRQVRALSEPVTVTAAVTLAEYRPVPRRQSLVAPTDDARSR
jgi:23S rRNA (guanine745-N1)-methyltransferase